MHRILQPPSHQARSAGTARGFTLVELMITLTVLSVIALAIGAVLMSSARSKTATTNQVESVQAARSALAMISNDLRSAGYDGVEVTTADGAALVSETAYDAIVLTASLPIYQPRFERALKYGGRLLAVVGSAPVMEARLVRRLGPAEFSSQVLFETCLEPLEHAPAPPAFKF